MRNSHCVSWELGRDTAVIPLLGANAETPGKAKSDKGTRLEKLQSIVCIGFSVPPVRCIGFFREEGRSQARQEAPHSKYVGRAAHLDELNIFVVKIRDMEPRRGHDLLGFLP